ncbi:Ig-like domain-containing protein [Pseudomonas aeruginosa]|uniref:tandem-95 repeat protein n=1 Tax=Pseudomonas aeruginosa TaxID=287 RepID=UPI002B26E8E0|nr:Ig-like domain-containing protein [Pseudomonas aeruginosa]MEA8592976.1 Ig-like domain-containing protein [Pseudomonas aeruginosa]
MSSGNAKGQVRRRAVTGSTFGAFTTAAALLISMLMMPLTAVADGGTVTVKCYNLKFASCPSGQTGYQIWNFEGRVMNQQASGYCDKLKAPGQNTTFNTWTKISDTCVAANTAPTAYALSFSTNEDTTGNFPLSVYDPDTGDSHTYTLLSQPAAAGSAYVSGSTLTFIPKPNWNGTATLTYQATDSQGAVSNSAVITITVNPVNDAPVAADMSLTLDEDSPGSVVLLATDVDSPAPTIFQIVSAPNPTYGAATLSGATLVFTPAANWYGTTTLTYRAQDSAGAWSAPATVTVVVRPVNDPPVVANRSLSTLEDTPATITLSASDIDSSSFTFEVVGQPANGSVSIVGSALTFTPARNWSGGTSITYRAKDDAGAWSNIGTISITVSPVNDAPVAQPRTLTIDEDVPGETLLIATDIDSVQAFTFALEKQAQSDHGTAFVEGDKLRFVPALDWHGTSTVTYRARDVEGAWSEEASVIITVRPVNDTPVSKNAMRLQGIESIHSTVTGKVMRN